MKRLKLTNKEADALTRGPQRFWRAMRNQPTRTMVAVFEQDAKPEPYWNVGGFRLRETARNHYPCPYGKPGDQIILVEQFCEHRPRRITAITVEQREGRWGWVVEVGE